MATWLMDPHAIELRERSLDYEAMTAFIEPAPQFDAATRVHMADLIGEERFLAHAEQRWGSDVDAMERWVFQRQHELYRALARHDVPLIRAAVRNADVAKKIADAAAAAHLRLGVALAVAQLEDTLG